MGIFLNSELSHIHMNTKGRVLSSNLRYRLKLLWQKIYYLFNNLYYEPEFTQHLRVSHHQWLRDNWIATMSLDSESGFWLSTSQPEESSASRGYIPGVIQDFSIERILLPFSVIANDSNAILMISVHRLTKIWHCWSEIRCFGAL